jgi:hypothetical protein
LRARRTVRHPAADLRRRQHGAAALLVPVQDAARDRVRASLGLDHAHVALVDAQYALRHGEDRVLDGGRRPARGHRPVGDRAELQQHRAAAGEEVARAVRAPGLHHRVHRVEQDQLMAAAVAEAMDLAQQVRRLRERAARAGLDHRHPADVAVGGTAERDRGPGAERLLVAGDRAEERLGTRAVEQPDHVVAPVEAAERRVQRLEPGAHSLLMRVRGQHRYTFARRHIVPDGIYRAGV